MQTAKEKFDEIMKNPEMQEWYYSRPKKIKELIQAYPFEKYRMKNDAPYGFSCPGQAVHLNSFMEDGTVTVVVLAKEMIPEALEHVRIKCLEFGRDFKKMKTQNVSVNVDPKYLEPIE